MLIKRVVLALGAMALAIVLAAPTYAQTLINQLPGADTPPDEVPIQSAINNADLSAPGTSESSFAGQQPDPLKKYSNGLNILGPTAYFGVSTIYTINQIAGDITVPSIVQQTATNSIVVDNAPNLQPALSSVTAGGFQQASNAVNSANFAPNQGSLGNPTLSKGSLTQLVSLATLSATNTMSATVYNGTASVIGSALDGTGAPGYQQAFGTLNTAGVLVDISTTLALQQKMGGPNSITATNSAIANSIVSTSATLDPSVLTLNQASIVGVNQIDFKSVSSTPDPIYTPTDTVTNLSGFQPGGLLPVDAALLPGYPVGLTATIGNVAVAYTGPTVGPNYNVGAPGTGGDGAAVVNGVTQSTMFGLNNITGGAGVSLNLDGLPLPYSSGPPATGWQTANLPKTGVPYNPVTDGFLQYVDQTTIKLATLYDGDLQNTGGAKLKGIVNLLGARVNNGSASITGGGPYWTQSFTNQLNSIDVGGTLSGKATQAALNMDQGGITGSSNGVSYQGYVNLAVANANTGPVSLTAVSQNMNQSLNTVSGAYGVDFTLNQAVTSPVRGCTLCSNNIQVAAGTGSNTATISGAQQSIYNSVNVAALGGISGASTITQTTANVNLSAVNQLVALNTFNASISGIQSASTAINVIGK